MLGEKHLHFLTIKIDNLGSILTPQTYNSKLW